MAGASRPLLIVLAATAALVAVWIVALKPKPVAIENTPLSSTRVLSQADQASAISDAANARLQAAAAAADGSAPLPAAVPRSARAAAAAADGSAPLPAAGPRSARAAAAAADGSAPLPAAVPKGAQQAATPQAGALPATAKKLHAGERESAQVERDVARGNVVVLLFWSSTAADDVATRGVLRGLDRRGGKVVVRVAPIGDVARYASVTRGVKIAGSPTTLVIGRKGAPRVISGLTEPRELSQAVGDALAGR